MTTNGKLTISRVDHSHGESTMEITLHDTDSVTGIKAQLSLKDYALAISGMGRVDCKLSCEHPERLGLKRESMDLKFPCKDTSTAKDEAKKACPDGWEPDLHFGSHSSFFQRDGKQWARTTAYRWVEKDA